VETRLDPCMAANGVFFVVLFSAVFNMRSTSLTLVSQRRWSSVLILSNVTIVRFARSTCPFACGCLVELRICSIL